MNRGDELAPNKKCFKLSLSDFKSCIADGVSLERFNGKQPVFLMAGTIEAGDMAVFAIDGVDFSVGEDTWIFGELKVGVFAKVEGTMNSDNCRYARKIVVKDSLS